VTPHAENDAAFGVLLLALASCLGRRVGRAVRR
jgi:hypothetical protein